MKPMLCTDHDDQDLTKWHAQEKLDGHRASWDGKRLWSRGGKIIDYPHALPAIALDGELWAGRGNLHRVTSAVNGGGWDGVRFVAFDAPGPEPIEERLARLLTVCDTVEIAETRIMGDMDEALDFTREIFENGGEGAVFKRPGSLYIGYRSEDWQRLKPCPTIEAARVLAHNERQSVQAGWNGRQINLGTKGRSLSIGQVIEFLHNGVLPSGQPRFARLA